MSKKLTVKQKKFADEYIISGNASEAALKAGYKNEVSGRENLQKPTIKKYIDERMKELEDKAIADATEVLQILTAHARRETYDWQITNKGDIVKIITPIKDSIRAAELLGKRYALFTEKVDLDTDITLVFEDDYGEEDEED